MMDTVAQRLLENVGWGLKMRLYTGAGLSTMDLLTDVYMTYTYATTEGQQGTALSLGIMVGMCLLLQLSIVWMQTHKGPRRVVLREVLIVLTGLAPGVHAMRVADGNKKSEHAAVEPELELTIVRCLEMACEAVPASVLQTYALLKTSGGGGDFSYRALASIVVSALTTGFVAASISFE
jgi:hypothetical protein